jgi:hypothetical protein
VEIAAIVEQDNVARMDMHCQPGFGLLPTERNMRLVLTTLEVVGEPLAFVKSNKENPAASPRNVPAFKVLPVAKMLASMCSSGSFHRRSLQAVCRSFKSGSSPSRCSANSR